MNTNQFNFATRASVTAVRAALLALTFVSAAHAADPAPLDPAVADLVLPTSSATGGVEYVTHDSYKFGEYNGLRHRGLYVNGDLDLRGGARYDSDDPTRWSIVGRNLGLDNRSINFEFSKQGSFRLNFGYDEIERNRSDSYQTPYLGTGTNTLTLPSNWIHPTLPRVSSSAINARGLDPTVSSSSALINGVLTPPTAAQLATSAALQAADLPAFHHVDLSTKRERYDADTVFQFGPQWEFRAGVRHEDKTGLKPMGTVTRFGGFGDISTIIPDLINQTTDQLNTSVTYTAEKGYIQAAYYASLFNNNVPSMTWANWATDGGSTSATMSSAPSNQFHQLTLTGGYAFSPTTKLTSSASYARTTQNEGLLTDSSTVLVPEHSTDALVITKAFSLKLTAKPASAWNLSAGYKHDERDNKTPVKIFAFYDANDSASATAANAAFQTAVGLTGLGNNININATRPYSKRVNDLNLDADFHVTNKQVLKGGVEYETIDRWCDGSWIDCVDAAKTKEGTASLEWLGHYETVSTKVGYAYSHRTVDAYNENAFLALVPMANVVPTGATASAYQTMLQLGFTGYGPALGLPTTALTGNQLFFFANNNALSNVLYANNNRISELIGMRRYNMADRNRGKLRSSVNWQATDTMSFQAGLDLNKDDYENSTYGLQNAKGWALNLDATFAPTENFSLSAFYTREDQRSTAAGNTYTANSTATNVNTFTAISGGCYATIALRNASNKIDPCLNWSADMRDVTDTLGLAFRQKQFLHPKFDLSGDLTYSRARSDNNVSGGNYVNNPLAVTGAAAGTIAAFYIPASALPTVISDTIALNLHGAYALSKDATVRVGYTYGHMHAVDWQYDGLQFGGLSGVLPTLEQAPNYTVHVIAVAYSYRFQ